MLVVLLVTPNALDRSVAVFSAARMAAFTLQTDMPSRQRIVGEVVIKARFVELNDDRIAPRVVDMAGAALTGRGMKLAVKPSARRDVGSDRLVADVAQLRLHFLLEIEVARFASCLELGVFCRQRSRRDQFFKNRLGAGRNSRGKQNRKPEKRPNISHKLVLTKTSSTYSRQQYESPQ